MRKHCGGLILLVWSMLFVDPAPAGWELAKRPNFHAF